MKIHVYKKGWLRQKYHFCVIASNGKTLLTSENYFNLNDVLSAIDSIKFEIKNAEIFYK